MSYILEALKRSQQERELGQVPSLASATSVPGATHGRLWPWLAAALGLAVLAMGIALFALYGTRRGRPEPPPPLVQAAPGPAVAPASADRAGAPLAREPVHAPPPSPRRPAPPRHKGPRAAAPPQPALPKVAAPSLPALPQPPADSTIPSDLVKDVQRFREQVARSGSAPARAAAPPPPAPAPAPRANAPASAAAGGGKSPAVPTFRQLPAAVRARIPPIHMSVHVYAVDPAQRFAVIGSRKLREGERTDDGLELEEIRPDGVVLVFQGQRFFVGR